MLILTLALPSLAQEADTITLQSPKKVMVILETTEAEMGFSKQDVLADFSVFKQDMNWSKALTTEQWNELEKAVGYIKKLKKPVRIDAAARPADKNLANVFDLMTFHTAGKLLNKGKASITRKGDGIQLPQVLSTSLISSPEGSNYNFSFVDTGLKFYYAEIMGEIVLTLEIN